MPTIKRPRHRRRNRQRFHWISLANAGVILCSALACLLALMVRLPGLNIGGIGPNWVLLWVVTWSVHHNWWQGLVGGLCLGLLQDSLTSPHPSHALGLACVGLLAGRLQKQELVGIELISVALIVFFMTGFVEVVMACQLTLDGRIPWVGIWQRLPLTALGAALLTSLWTPAIYWPLKQWWDQLYPRLERRPWP